VEDLEELEELEVVCTADDSCFAIAGFVEISNGDLKIHHTDCSFDDVYNRKCHGHFETLRLRIKTLERFYEDRSIADYFRIGFGYIYGYEYGYGYGYCYDHDFDCFYYR